MKVEFNVLQTPEESVLLDSIVDYVLQSYSKQRIAILAPTGTAKRLDDILWQDGQESFVPHHCAINAKDYSAFKNIPILITDNLFIASGFDILINIMDVAVDPKRVRVNILKEYVYQEAKALDASRRKYVYYKKLGLDITTVK